MDASSSSSLLDAAQRGRVLPAMAIASGATAEPHTLVVSTTRTVTDEHGHTSGVTVADVADADTGTFLAESTVKWEQGKPGSPLHVTSTSETATAGRALLPLTSSSSCSGAGYADDRTRLASGGDLLSAAAAEPPAKRFRTLGPPVGAEEQRIPTPLLDEVEAPTPEVEATPIATGGGSDVLSEASAALQQPTVTGPSRVLYKAVGLLPEGPTLKEFRAGVAARYSVPEGSITFAGPDGSLLPLETPIIEPVTRDFTAFISEASGTVTSWQFWFARQGDHWVPGPRLTSEELDMPVTSSAALGAGIIGSAPSDSSHPGLGSSATSTGTEAVSTPSDFALGSAHMHSLPSGGGGGGGGAVVAQFDETDLVASGTGKTYSDADYPTATGTRE